MQLDKTRIAIRERGYLDLLDISLQVLKHYPIAIFGYSLITIVPLMFLNSWFTSWIVADEYTVESRMHFLWTQGLLIFIEAPLVSLLVTLYLGRTMFMENPTSRELIRELIRQLPRLFLSVFVLRGILIAWLLMLTVDPLRLDFSPAYVFLPLLALVVAAIRGMRPFINEIILLEKSPFFTKDPDIITVGKRSSMLHNPSSGDLFARYLASIPATCVLLIVLAGGLWFCVGLATNDMMWGPVILHFCFPFAGWLVVTFFSVFRFLNYLDLRIRREGWETELLVRAAAARYAE